MPKIAHLALAGVIALLALAGPAPVAAQRAIDGATAHPSVPIPQEAYITRDDFVDFAEIDFPSAPFQRGQEREVLTVAGAHTRQEITIDGTEIASLRLYTSYLQHFQNAGYEIVFAGIGEELGPRRSVDFLASTIFAATPSTASNAGYILARSPDGGEVLALGFFDRQNARRIMVNVVAVEEMETVDLFAAAPAPEPEPEPEAPAAAAPVQTGAELETGLVADGRVVVNAILFAFDSDEILSDSARALDTVAGLMAERPALSLLVVGHTDGVGSFDYNLRLSLARASAVVDWLVREHGIDSARLRPAGAGPMSPITTNRTEQGRALNRRVELVEVVD